MFTPSLKALLIHIGLPGEQSFIYPLRAVLWYRAVLCPGSFSRLDDSLASAFAVQDYYSIFKKAMDCVVAILIKGRLAANGEELVFFVQACENSGMLVPLVRLGGFSEF